jgi:hypothetical protein
MNVKELPPYTIVVVYGYNQEHKVFCTQLGADFTRPLNRVAKEVDYAGYATSPGYTIPQGATFVDALEANPNASMVDRQGLHELALEVIAAKEPICLLKFSKFSFDAEQFAQHYGLTYEFSYVTEVNNYGDVYKVPRHKFFPGQTREPNPIPDFKLEVPNIAPPAWKSVPIEEARETFLMEEERKREFEEYMAQKAAEEERSLAKGREFILSTLEKGPIDCIELCKNGLSVRQAAIQMWESGQIERVGSTDIYRLPMAVQKRCQEFAKKASPSLEKDIASFIAQKRGCKVGHICGKFNIKPKRVFDALAKIGLGAGDDNVIY